MFEQEADYAVTLTRVNTPEVRETVVVNAHGPIAAIALAQETLYDGCSAWSNPCVERLTPFRYVDHSRRVLA